MFAYYHYPYFPGFIYIEALSIFFAKFGFPYMLFLKLFFSAFDIGVIYLLYLLTKKNTQVAFLYAVNPAMIFLSSAHGQIEALPIFFSLLAFYLYREKKELLTSLALGFAILAKVWPLFFLPFFLKYTKKWYMYAVALAIPALSVLIYALLFHTLILSVLHPPFSYRGGYGAWGISTVTQLFLPADKGINNAIIKSVTNLTILLLLGVFFIRKKTNILTETSIFMLLFGAFVMSGANPVWLVPFILLLQPPKWEYWFFVVNMYMSISITAEVFHMLNKSSHVLFTTAVFIAMILWVINLVIVFDFLKVKKIILRYVKHLHSSNNNQ